jgi:flagellar basal-body rod modification protein FlgD
MTTNSVGSVTNTLLKTTTKGTSLDRDAFLSLLLTELRNQDPMNPVEDKDFIAQLASFSTLEQTQQLNIGFASFRKTALATQAFAMIGKMVDYADVETGSVVSGKVSAVKFEDGLPSLVVNGRAVDLSTVVKTYEAS